MLRTAIDLTAWYPGIVEKETQHSSTKPSRLPRLSIEELAAQQGIAPVQEFEALLGRPAAEDESAEEFSAMLRAWRSEGIGTSDPE